MATTEESARAEGGGEPSDEGQVHGGKLVARALADRGVSKLFTLSGGHLFSIYDGCVAEGIDLIDTRHEQAAAWAAEGYAKATRKPGVAALTAGPGVTNGMSALAGAKFNRSPLVVLGGRAPEMRWGSGSLQEIDHLPFVSPLTKSAETVKSTGDCGAATARAIDTALHGPTGPTYVDYPLDVVFMEGEGEVEPKPVFAPTEAEGVEEPAAAAGAGRAPGDHGRHRRLLVTRRGRAPAARRGARHPGLPQRHGQRVSARRPRPLLLPRPRPGAEGGRRRASSPASRSTSASASAAPSARRRRSSGSTSRRTSSAPTASPSSSSSGRSG